MNAEPKGTNIGLELLDQRLDQRRAGPAHQAFIQPAHPPACSAGKNARGHLLWCQCHALQASGVDSSGRARTPPVSVQT